MPNSTELTQERQLELTIEEIQAIISTRRGRAAQEILVMYFEIGEAVHNSPLYLKFAHGTGSFIEQIAEELGMSNSSLYAAVKAFEKYKEVSSAVESLSVELNKPFISWTDVKRSLVPVPSISGPRCGHCSIHCPPRGA